MAAPFDIPSETMIFKEASTSTVDVEYLKKEMMKLQSPLPPFQPSSSSSSSFPPEFSRLNMSLDKAIEFELIHGRKLDANMDTKTLRRTISNRLSAQRSRIKRSQYIIDMEKRIKDLEEFVASLRPQIAACNEKKRQLQIENDSLRRIFDVRVSESKISDEKLEEKRREIKEIKETLICKHKEAAAPPPPPPPPPPPYSIEFYQERLMQLEMNQFITQQLNSDPMIDLTFDEEDEEIDQYLNLEEEEELNLL